MQLSDIEQRLVFLDEERRRERETVDQLRSLATSQAAQLQALGQNLVALTDDLKTTQAYLTRLDAFDVSVAQIRSELIGLIEVQGVQAKTEVARLRETDSTEQARTESLGRLIQGLEARMTTAQTLTAELRDRLARQSEASMELSRAIQALRADLTTTQSQLIKFPQIEQALQNAKTELTHLVQTYRGQNQAEVERLAQERLQDRQLVTRGLAELDARLNVIPPIHERLAGHDQETTRLSTALNHLAAQIDGIQREIGQRSEPIPGLAKTQLDHGQRIDRLEGVQPGYTLRMDGQQNQLQLLDELITRHADRLDLVEMRLPEFDRGDAELLEKVEFLEDWVQRTATRLDEVQRFEDDLRRTLTEAVEAEKVRDAHREQRLAGWAEELVAFRVMVEGWKKVMRAYEDHHMGVTRQMAEVDELGQHIRQEQKANIEAQRIEAEKIRREVGEWQQDVDKRWALFFKQRDWDWSEQKRVNDAAVVRLRQLEAWRAADVQGVSEVAERLDAKDRELLMRIEDIWEIEEQALQRRLSELKAWLGEVQESQAKTPKPRVPKPGEKILGTDPRYRRS